MKRLFATLLLAAALAFGQNPNVAVFPGGVATDNDLLVANNRAGTTVSSTVAANDTTINVASTSGFIVPVAITFTDNGEIAKCLTKTVTSFTSCTRGFDSGAGGIAATSHAVGVGVQAFVVASYFNQLAAEVKAVEAVTLSNPMTTLGDTIYGGASGVATRLAGNTTATKKFLTQTGTGSASAAPVWATIAAGDVPTLNQNTTGNAATATALAATPSGCGANQYANAIAASGNLTCTQVAYSQVSGTPTLRYQTVQDEGIDLTQRTKVNFIGSTITCADNAGTLVTDCTVSASSAAHNLLSATHSDTVAHTAVLGDIIYANSTPAWQALAGNTTTTRKFLRQTGTGSVSAAPAWDTLQSGDIPANAANTSGNAATATALAADPTDCSATQFANAIAANGNLTCALAYSVVQDEGSSLTQRATLNFIGTGVVCADNSGSSRTDCTIGTPTTRIEYIAGVCQNGVANIGASLPASNAPTAVCVTGTNTNYGVAEFTATSQSMQGHFTLPSTWTGTLSADIKYRSVATTGNAVWALATICVADGATGDPAFNTASTVTDAVKGTTLQFNDATISSVTVTGCSAGQELFWKFSLDSTTTATGNQDLISLIFKAPN